MYVPHHPENPAAREETRMRRLIASIYTTLDGVVDMDGDMVQKWHFPFFNDELATYAHQQLFAADALLLGRRTYDGFAATWPSITDEQGFADRMNHLPKYVVSTTLATAAWNNTTIIRDQVPDAVTTLKQQPGQDILLYGSATLMHTLMHDALIDEYRLWVHPVVAGSGRRLFQDSEEMTLLQRTAITPFSSGVTILHYQPAGKDEQAAVRNEEA
jgi:dihydrofolate reductase